MKDKEDFFEKKDDRRKKIKLKNNKKRSKSSSGYEDDQDVNNLVKKDIKKIKETFQDEEWEDWDRYYNH
jgi:hypothetical protein